MYSLKQQNRFPRVEREQVVGYLVKPLNPYYGPMIDRMPDPGWGILKDSPGCLTGEPRHQTSRIARYLPPDPIESPG